MRTACFIHFPDAINSFGRNVRSGFLRTGISLQKRDLPGMVSIAENQRRIAGILAVAEPNLQAIYDEFNEINKLFPSLARPGHIRLYYETAAGYATVTAYTDKIIVTVPRGQQVDVYNLLQQGDTLPGAVRQLFR